MGSQADSRFSVMVQSPDCGMSTRTLTLDPESKVVDVKRALLLANENRFYFSFDGKVLEDAAKLRDCGVSWLSTLVLRMRVLGGGGDGGATGAESRDCYLNMYAEKKPDKVDPNEQRLSKWTTCALSSEPLKPPCVVDKLGNLFNKEALVEGLIGKKLPKAFGHIKGLKDMVKIELEMIPGGESAGAMFHCPITGLEFNGKYKFLAIRTCGHVLSAKALKEVKALGCLVCHKEFSEDDKIVINGSEEEVAALRERMEEERVKFREKKSKKVKNGAVVEENGHSAGDPDSPPKLSGSKHQIDAKAAEKALAKTEVNGKLGNGSGVLKKDGGNASAKRFKATDVIPPNATKEVYASIFISSRKSDFKETYSCRSLPLGRN
uniref:Ubiquitin-like domain-containing protein n=1 Tax=Kalanchoe fedtschenkoi TaxID=63787 RepID=A0A7N0RFG1_KALFE